MLEVTNVTKKYGRTLAINSLSFKVEKGDFLFITGPSGSGKTTLLRIIIKDVLPTSGSIILDGEEITKLPSKKVPRLRQKIGVVFQDYKVLPQLTLKENIEVALAVIGLPKNKWKERVDNVLQMVDLSDKKDLFPSQLSGGELQRASLARALVKNPVIILADEPTGNLDWETAENIMNLLLEINKSGKTILMATHHKMIVEKYGKNIVELKKHKPLPLETKSKKKKEKSKTADMPEIKEEEMPKDDKEEVKN